MTALVDTDDVHCLMIGASGVGKTAFFLYPNLEYACASGMSFLTTDTKGDLYRNYGAIARDHYGYHVAVIDLRNPTRSDGNYYKDGKALTGEQTINGVKYYFCNTGVLQTGWVKVGDNWHFYSGNRMLVGWWDIGSE